MRPRRSGRKPVARWRQAVDCPADAVALLSLAMASNTLPPTLLRDERATLAELAAFLRARFPNRLRDLRLFGSRARGEGHEESDLDLLIAIDDLKAPDEREVLQEFHRQLDRHGVVIGGLLLDSQKWRQMQQNRHPLVGEIDRDGVCL